MNFCRIIASLLLLFVCAPTYAQWQVPDHSVPVGRGSGSTGFKNVLPGGLGGVFTSQGPNSDPAFQAITPATIGAPGLATNNIYSGNNYFKSGRPWADVRAWGAVCDLVNDDTVAIQGAINAVDGLGGGAVFFPPGHCLVSTTLTVARPTCLVGTNGGSQTGNTSVRNNGDFVVVAFAAGQQGACLNGLSVFGYLNSAATNPAVTVGQDSAVHMNNCTIWGGTFGLSTAGSDGRIYNCNFLGFSAAGGGVFSTGANFWYGNKIDNSSFPTSYGFFQGVPLTDGENYFFGNDFSGTYTVASFFADDGGNNLNFFVHNASVFSAPVIVTHALHTSFVSSTFGVSLNNAAGTLNIVGSYGIIPVTVTGAGARSCAGNTNVTC